MVPAISPLAIFPALSPRPLLDFYKLASISAGINSSIAAFPGGGIGISSSAIFLSSSSLNSANSGQSLSDLHTPSYSLRATNSGCVGKALASQIASSL